LTSRRARRIEYRYLAEPGTNELWPIPLLSYPVPAMVSLSLIPETTKPNWFALKAGISHRVRAPVAWRMNPCVRLFASRKVPLFELLALWFVRTLRRQTNRDSALLRITFTHTRNADQREVHRLLRCPVDFGQAVDSWVLPQRATDLPIVFGDSYLLQILTAYADDLLAERHSATALQRMVASQLACLLSSGESGAAAVARRLGMSTRSLTRQLAEEGTTFGEIRGRLRQRLAARYLADDRLSIQQIAWLLGYSEPGAFSHAFKRWTGTSPRQARKQQPSPVPS
jgi:AraC-like DNA-binding protein